MKVYCKVYESVRKCMKVYRKVESVKVYESVS